MAFPEGGGGIPVMVLHANNQVGHERRISGRLGIRHFVGKHSSKSTVLLLLLFFWFSFPDFLMAVREPGASLSLLAVSSCLGVDD